MVLQLPTEKRRGLFDNPAVMAFTAAFFVGAAIFLLPFERDDDE